MGAKWEIRQNEDCLQHYGKYTNALKKILELSYKVAFHSGRNAPCYPSAGWKCEVPPVLALRSCAPSRMVLEMAFGKVVKWWSLSLWTQGVEMRSQTSPPLSGPLSTLSCQIIFQEASSEKLHWSNSPSHLCPGLPLKACMHLQRQRGRCYSTTQWNANASLSGHRASSSLVGWALSLLLTDVSKSILKTSLFTIYHLRLSFIFISL